MPTPSISNLTDAQFTRIYHDHARHVMCAARRLGVSPENLPDVVQEVWLLASRRLPDLDLSQPLGPWLTRVVWHFVQHLRRSYARHARRLQALTAAHPTEPAAEPHARGEVAWTLEPALDGLPDEQRTVLLLADYEGMTAKEISEALGVGLNTVYSRLRLARQRCRDSITAGERRLARPRRRHETREPAAR